MANTVPGRPSLFSQLTRKIFLINLLWLIWASLCAAQSSSSRELELQYLRTVVHPSLLEYAHLEIPSLDHIRVLTEGGKSYLGLRTYYGQKRKSNGVRAETSIDYPFQEGETIRYSWRFMLPTDFQSDAPRNRWWVFGQWHDQPNRLRGETWDGFPGHSPPVLLGYGQLNGKDYLSFTYGAPHSKPIGLIEIARGRWQDISVEVTWSRGADGKAAVYFNNTPTPKYQASGPNMLNDFQHYLKVGSYRNPDIRGDAWIYIDDITIQRVDSVEDDRAEDDRTEDGSAEDESAGEVLGGSRDCGA